MGTFGRNVQSNHPSRKENKGNNSWEFCSAEAAVAWPWSVRRGSAGGKWRERTGDSSNREKSSFYLPWFNKMRTQRRKSQTGEASNYCLVPVFLDLGRQESWGVWGSQPPRWANGPLPTEPELSVWSTEYNRILITHFPFWIAHFGGNQVLLSNNFMDLPKPTEPQLWLNPAATAESSGGWRLRQQLDLGRDPEPELPN